MKKLYRFAMAVAVALSVVATGCSSESDELIEGVENTDNAEDSEGSKGTEDEVPVDNTRHDLVLGEGEAAIVENYNRKSFELLDKLAVSESKNVYTSPVSLNILLSMFANGVTGEARTELFDYLGATTLSQLNTFNTRLMDELVKLDNQSDLHMANSLWGAPGFSFLSSYKDAMESSYHGAFFADVPLSTEEGRTEINQWCSEKTAGLIPEFLENPLDPQTRYFLVNALYFKGKWKHGFDKSRTTVRTFTKADGSSQYAHFMEKNLNVKTLTHEGTRILELPFGNEAYVLDILMPEEGTAVKSLTAEAQLISMLDKTPEAEARVSLPRFKIECNYDNLVPVLKEVGLNKMFDGADFSDMTSADIKNVDVIKQKNVFEVDESGAKSATVSGGGMVTYGGDPVPLIAIDRPFMFVVRETSTGLFISLGVVNKI